ncbi:hypothetical protein JB92DRAFT_2835691 [Gautieria morchelliformis]|nr:hypothetical protein JB92DRAFT_2835691 [Gautieria morchelliformis]
MTKNNPLLQQKKPQPAIQTSALDWQDVLTLQPPKSNGKGCAKAAPAMWDEYIPQEVAGNYKICPDGIYEHMGKIMMADKEQGNRLWEMSYRLFLATVYSTRTLGPLAHRNGVTGKIQRAVTELLAEECPNMIV